MEGNAWLFQEIGNIADEVYFVYNATSNGFSYINKAFETIWKLPADSILNSPQKLLSSIHPEDKAHVSGYYQDTMQHARANQFEFRIICPEQSIKYILLKIYPLKDNKDEYSTIAGIAEDITVLKRNLLYAEKINARKNSTLEIMAHDLKGPIGIINMMASAIQQNPEVASNKNVLSQVQIILDLCERNIALIRDVTSQEFLESPEVDLRTERADLVWSINDVIENYKRSANVIQKTFILTSSVKELYMQIDTLKFIQVVNNLISNAIKFTPDDGVIKVDIQDHNTTAIITISDNGIGIPDELQPYLFDKFTRARRTGLRGEEPVGLGMCIIKTIVGLHGGRIWFESKENQGSAFYIELPK